MNEEPALIGRFKSVFSRLTPDTRMPLEELYADDVEFQDPLHRVEGLTALAAYFDKLNARIESADFTFGESVVTQDRAAVQWVMTARMRRPRQVLTVPGVSMLRFDDRITSQRDYFDVGAMLYERLPLLGRLLRRMKRAVA